MSPTTLGVILAGGLGRRMGGRDKPLLRLGGLTLLERMTGRLAPQCSGGLILSANGDPARFAGFPGSVVPDGVEGHAGPLAGILAALEHAAERTNFTACLPCAATSRSHPYPEARPRLAPQDEGVDEADRTIRHVVSVSGDAPFLPRDLVARLHAARAAAGTPIAVAASGERRHFTVALWSVDLRTDLRAALIERDERRVGAFIAHHGAAVASWPTEPVDPFLNVNAPEDLAAAEAALARSEA